MLPIISENRASHPRQNAVRARTHDARANNMRTRSTRASRARTNACSMDSTREKLRCKGRDGSGAGASRGKGASKGINDQKAAKPLKKVFPQAPRVAHPNQPRGLSAGHPRWVFPQRRFAGNPRYTYLNYQGDRNTNTNVTYTWDVPQTRAVREIPGGMSRKASCGKSQVRFPAKASCGKFQVECPAKAMRDTAPGMSRSLPES
jgi:hypothetical protein